jgi:hypothetical protein
MITAFFKPKSAKKVTPAGTTAPPKRALEDGANPLPNKRLKSASPPTDAVEELLSYLNEPARDGDQTTWKDILKVHSTTPSFARLADFVAAQR